MEWCKHRKEKNLSQSVKLFKQDSTNQSKTKQSDQKTFCQGQMKKALKFVGTANDIDGKHDINRDIINNLQEKLPKAEEITTCHNLYP